MKKFDKIFDQALDNYGVITVSQANDVGVLKQELFRFVKDGRLRRLWRGVYVIEKYIPTEFDKYAQAVAIVGKDSYVYGTSVLAMLGLAFLNPVRINIATQSRVRKTLPIWINLVKKSKKDNTDYINGIRCQKLFDAFIESQDKVLPERLIDGAKTAQKQGYLTRIEYSKIMKELNNVKAK